MCLPDEVGIQLTNRCNLRCAHCFQWNKEGFFNNFKESVRRKEISFEIVKKILVDTSEVKSNLYLWGGEPLNYGEWDKLSDELEKDPRWTVLCTNGIDIEKRLDSIVKISPNLAMLISLDGFRQENDSIRGKGTYLKIMRNIDLLMDLKRKNIFRGEISVNCVISENMAGHMFEFAMMLEEKGINTLYFCFPWYIPEIRAIHMDAFFRENFSWLREPADGHIASWHSFKYSLMPLLAGKITEEMKRINSRVWKIRLRYQPALEMEEVEDFIRGREITAQKRTKCIGITNRMNVMPDGRVTVCKLFPEFEIGDLNKMSVSEIWKSRDFDRAREILSRGLMPVCSKCVLLYLHGV